MNREWIDRMFIMLCTRVGVFSIDPHSFYFEPTDRIYASLESGDERDLRAVVTQIGNHLELTSNPSASYEWGLKMEPEVAGRISWDNNWGHIQVPFFYVGKKYALGRILAHEMTHAFLASKHIALSDAHENEMLTDLGTVFLGLGKLLLNGLLVAEHEYTKDGYLLGYISYDLFLYAYKKTNDHRSIAWDITVKNLLPDVIGRLSGLDMGT